MHSHVKQHLVQDLLVLAGSIFITVVLLRTHAFDSLFTALREAPVLASFIAGFFFTSVITFAPAAVAISQIGQFHPVVEVAFFGALGAASADLILFLFVQKRIKKDIDDLISESSEKNVLSVFRLEFLRWLNPVLGVLIIASPLPDEIGVALLAFSKVRVGPAVVFVFCLHFLGILAVISALQILI